MRATATIRATLALAALASAVLLPAAARADTFGCESAVSISCGPGSSIIIGGVDCCAAATGGGGKPAVHCTAEALGQEIEAADGDAETTPFTFESLGCKCETANNVVFVSCPADADASYGIIGKKIDFRYAQLNNMTLEGANLEDAKFDYASCNGCSFAGAELSNADMDYIKASSANFTAATLDGAEMEYGVFNGASFAGASMDDVDGEYAKFKAAVLTGASMKEADLEYAHFPGADLKNVDLTGADLEYAILSDADLTGAELKNADLSYAKLRGAVGFTDATCSGATWDYTTCPSGKQVGWDDKGCDPGCAA